MLISGLDVTQLYLLSAILLVSLSLSSSPSSSVSRVHQSRKFRDPVGCLPEPLALHLLSYLPPKDLLRNCTTVHTPHTHAYTHVFTSPLHQLGKI